MKLALTPDHTRDVNQMVIKRPGDRKCASRESREGRGPGGVNPIPPSVFFFNHSSCIILMCIWRTEMRIFLHKCIMELMDGCIIFNINNVRFPVVMHKLRAARLNIITNMSNFIEISK